MLGGLSHKWIALSTNLLGESEEKREAGSEIITCVYDPSTFVEPRNCPAAGAISISEGELVEADSSAAADATIQFHIDFP
jgi:hypothetical protein